MSLSFRNLAVLALLFGVISSLTMSPSAQGGFNNHMLRVHETAGLEMNHQQKKTDATSFVNKMQTIINTIQGSIQPNVPAIIQTKNLPTFAFSRDICESLQQDNKTQLLAQLKSTKKSVTDFKTKLTDQKVVADADNSLQYLNVAELLLNRNCQDIGDILVGPTPYQTNINTPRPWIYGGLTMKDIVKSYINRVTANSNVTNCGLNTPFWNGLKCISCENKTPVFNMGESKCIACPTRTVYDDATKNCLDTGIKSYKPNPVAQPLIIVPAQAPKSALSDYMKTGQTLCPTDKPFVLDNTCVSSPQGKPYYNVLTKGFGGCQSGYVFEPKTHTCIKGKPAATDVSANMQRLVMNENSTSADWDKYTEKNQNKIPCSVEKPFWTGTQCIQCPQLFNIITKQCTACEPGFSIHADHHKCAPAQPLQPYLIDLFNAIF